MFQGLRTVIYHVPDLAAAKAWYSAAFGTQPYFDEPFYVGFNIAGYELGLNPDHTVARPGPGGAVAYWRVADIDRGSMRLEVLVLQQLEPEPVATRATIDHSVWSGDLLERGLALRTLHG